MIGSARGGVAQAALIQKPSLIDPPGYKARFLITDAPTESNIAQYIAYFENFNVRVVVRTCDPSYSGHWLEAKGIALHELPFPDGAFPDDAVIREWLRIIFSTFKKDPTATISVHCVAGLGRAPVLVAIALIELGMDRMEAIQFVRQKRPKAFNLKQLNQLEKYKRKSGGKGCSVM
eukprot:c8268_g1_i2.p1 GENE.c8268_g1_i2~~c8268_g1_i2.p1  ORF type:complete len:176 (-),score=41.72 c8268_g1_i2:253-780(-)